MGQPLLENQVIVIDSHTGGEPTRLVIAGGPELGAGNMAERREVFREKHDGFRRAVIQEPRGWDAVVGALVCQPMNKDALTGLIFFNNVGYIGMCVHGTIGVVATHAQRGRIKPGIHRIETPVGEVQATLHDDGQVSVRNVPSYRYRKDVCVAVDGYGEVTGDVAWGGNGFFLMPWDDRMPPLTLAHAESLTQFTWAVRQALIAGGLTDAGEGEINHIEIFGAPTSNAADSKNFVLCPGKAYDRSPCGTGTSAKVACMYADGKLKPGEVWRQESITGSIFEASVEIDPADASRVIPTIKGGAYVTGETTLFFHPDDPFRDGIPSGGEPSRGTPGKTVS